MPTIYSRRHRLTSKVPPLADNEFVVMVADVTNKVGRHYTLAAIENALKQFKKKHGPGPYHGIMEQSVLDVNSFNDFALFSHTFSNMRLERREGQMQLVVQIDEIATPHGIILSSLLSAKVVEFRTAAILPGGPLHQGVITDFELISVYALPLGKGA